MNGYEKLFDVKHVRVTVVSLNRRMIPYASDEDVYLGEPGEVLSLYVKPDHGDYLTAWFSSHIDSLEVDNKLALGYIKRIEEFKGIPGAKFYVTKIGRFIVEETPCYAK